MTGKDAFIAVNAPFFAGITDSRLVEIVEAGDLILTQIETDVTTPAGETLTLEVAEWYRFNNSKLEALKVYFDTAEFRQTFGM